MTTTRAGTWQEATKGLRVQAKDGSIWTLERLTLEGIVISVTMAAEAEPGRTVVVHPASYDEPITIVETVPWAETEESIVKASPNAQAAAVAQGKAIAAEALAAQVAASTVTPTGFPPLSDAERAATTPAERAIAAKETLARHTAELQAKLADADRIAAEALAPKDVPYVAPMPEVQPEPETSAESAPVVDPANVAPIQAAGEVWPSPPADDWTEGEMFAHLFLFHGDWATGHTSAKSGKKLLLELHERHQKAHEAGHSAGLVHLHRSKE